MSITQKIHPVSLRTLKGWIAIGRDADPPDLPPLDAPERLNDWYSLHKKNRVPDWIVDLAVQTKRIEKKTTQSPPPGALPVSPPPPIDPATGPLFAAAAARTADTPPPEPRPSPPAGAHPASGTANYIATLQRLRDAEQIAGGKYATLAADPAKEAEAEQARRAWSNITKELRAYEKDAEQILRASGDLWIKADVIKASTEIHLAIRDGIRGLLRRVRPKLAGLTPTEEDALWQKEVEGLFARLRATSFTAPGLPAAVAPPPAAAGAGRGGGGGGRR
ncbi:MAG: hypothetical protein LBK99_26660, partial [Opitutaceae bacterium]|nr:hypothetical protein [Opitutaceae bacterium]